MPNAVLLVLAGLLAASPALAGQSCDYNHRVTIHISSDGEVLWNQHRISTRADLEALLAAAAKKDPQPGFAFVDMKSAKYDDVAAFLSAAQRAEIHCLGIVGYEKQ